VCQYHRQHLEREVVGVTYTEISLGIDLFTDTAAILDSNVSDIYYGMLRGQIYTNLPPEHPIITI